MKVKRLLGLILALCIALSLVSVFSVSVSAASEWIYTVNIEVRDYEDGDGCNKKNAINVKLIFDNESESTRWEASAKLANKVSRGGTATVTITSGYAPWMLDGIEISNSTKDSLWMYRIYIEAIRKGDTDESHKKTVWDRYTHTKGNTKTGVTVDKDDGGPQTRSWYFDVRRYLLENYLDNFATDFSKTYYLDAEKESGTINTVWTGKASDDYKEHFGGAYNCLNESGAPTMSLKVSGKKGDGGSVTASALSSNGFTDLKDNTGFKLDREKLLDYMNKNNVNTIEIETTLKFPENGNGGITSFTKTVTVKRKAFSFNSVNFGTNYHTASLDNYYYNASQNQITVDLGIKATDNYDMFSGLIGAKISFAEAYLQAGDNKINAKTTKNIGVMSKKITLTFPYSSGIDSQNQGLSLVLKNGTMSYGGQTYKLWDETRKTLGFSNQTNVDGYYKSTHKLDSKTPTITVVPVQNQNLTIYNKQVKLTITPDETTWATVGKELKEGYLTMQLKDKDSALRVYHYKTGSGEAYTQQSIPSSASMAIDITLALADKAEGEYDLVLTGRDVAGNNVEKVYSGIKLDNLPPRVSLKKEQNGPDAGVTFDATIEDASGTGRLYYMLTEKSAHEIADYKESDSASRKSGDLTSLLDKWAYLDQDDYENGIAKVYFSVEKGEAFSGTLAYFGMDDSGNKSDVFYETVEISNEDTDYTLWSDNEGVAASAHEITVRTNRHNTVTYNWIYNGKRLYDANKTLKKTEYDNLSDAIFTVSTAEDEHLKAASGTYVFECKIIPPTGEGKAKTVTREYILDNYGPEVSVTLLGEESFAQNQTVKFYVTDSSGVSAASAWIVTPDEENIEGLEEFSLGVSGGEVNQTRALDVNKSGAYAVKVYATDKHGFKTEYTSPVFFIRCAAPTGTVKLESELKHAGLPLLSKGEITLSFSIEEDFKNAKKAENQAVFYRIRTEGEESSWGEWTLLGDASNDGDKLSLTKNATITLALSNGAEGFDTEKTLYVQTAIADKTGGAAKINTDLIKNDEISFLFDEEAPTARLYINDVHTNESIVGYLTVSDNLDSEFTVTCDDESVEIAKAVSESDDADASESVTESKENLYTVTVKKNVDTVITVKDEAGNTAKVKLKVTDIDRDAPTVTMTSVSDEAVGKRKDVTATVTVSDVLGESIEFAFIPTSAIPDGTEYSDGDYSAYFGAYQDNPQSFGITELRSEDATYSGEKNITYKVKVAGVTGDWYLAVRAADTLGNKADVLLDNVLSPENADIELTAWEVKPRNAEKKAIVSLSFNVPVYVLPQDKVDSEGTDAKNFEAAKEGAAVYSEKATFTVSKNGTYYVYAADDLGRTAKIPLTINEEVSAGDTNEKHTVKFNTAGASSVKYTICERYNSMTPVASGKLVYAGSWQYSLVVEPDSDTTLILPEQSPYELYGNYTYYEDNGLEFNYLESSDYAVPYDGEEPGSMDFNNYEEAKAYFDKIKGYTKLVYNIHPISLDPQVVIEADVYERDLTVRQFSKDLDPKDESIVDLKVLVITEIDNTAPVVSWTATPEVLTLGEDGYEKHPTPGSVTYTVTAQDAQSGIDEIAAFEYYDEELGYEVALTVPMFELKKDDDGNPIPELDDEGNPKIDDYGDPIYQYETDENGEKIPTEYWCADGKDYKVKVGTEWSDDGYYTAWELKTAPVTVEYFGDGDRYGVKTLRYTFTEEFMLERAGIFYSGADAMSYCSIGFDKNGQQLREMGISTYGLIYSLPIEKGEDYKLTYYYKASDGTWKEITDDATYYKNAKAVITILERGKERGLTLRNNNGLTLLYEEGSIVGGEKELSSFYPEFTFELKDKYGYTESAKAELSNFDVEPGEIKCIFETTEKTNKPYHVYIYAEDEKSGVGSVKLTIGGVDVELEDPDDGDVYGGLIEKNGTYVITLYDNAGNKTVKSFNVSNIDTVTPTAAVIYSTTAWTTRPVTAAISFSKNKVNANGTVNITAVYSTKDGFTEGKDYTVNYKSREITFVNNGNVIVAFADDYGNESTQTVSVGNIDKTAPKVTATCSNDNAAGTVTVSFRKDADQKSPRELAGDGRKETEIYVSYGGRRKTVANEDGSYNTFTFYENGQYTFKVFDEEGLYTYCTVNIEGIDTDAPEITSISWSYSYDEYDAEAGWSTVEATGSRATVDGTVGYRMADDTYCVTNGDVTITVHTDSDTRLIGSDGEYSKENSKTYTGNGLYIFNTEKKNEKTATYGVDVEIIDKTPPTIDFGETKDLVFYESNLTYDRSMLLYDENGPYTAYTATDDRSGDLTAKVTVTDWGGFNAEDISENRFDSSVTYTVTYEVSDDAHNVTTAQRTIRLVGLYDTIATVNGAVPDYAGRAEVMGDTVTIELKNFSGASYMHYHPGINTMAQMKKYGAVIERSENGKYVLGGLDEGWHTFYIQTDKRDYFTLLVFVTK